MENAALALQAYAMLGLPWDPARLARALLQTRVVGRLDSRQVVWNGRRIALLLDVGHNPHAAAFLAQRLEQRPVAGTRLAVFGLLADKDLAGVLDALVPSISDWAVARCLRRGRNRLHSWLPRCLSAEHRSASMQLSSKHSRLSAPGRNRSTRYWFSVRSTAWPRHLSGWNNR